MKMKAIELEVLQAATDGPVKKRWHFSRLGLTWTPPSAMPPLKALFGKTSPGILYIYENILLNVKKKGKNIIIIISALN